MQTGKDAGGKVHDGLVEGGMIDATRACVPYMGVEWEIFYVGGGMGNILRRGC